MDAACLVGLIRAVNAFSRGEGQGTPLSAGARAAATRAAAALTRRLVFAHLGAAPGDGLDLAGQRDLARTLDALIAEGDGLPAGLADAEVVALWALRLEVQRHLAQHAGGGPAAVAEVDGRPQARAAWRMAEAAAGRTAGAPRWTEPRWPSVVAPPQAMPEAAPVPGPPEADPPRPAPPEAEAWTAGTEPAEPPGADPAAPDTAPAAAREDAGQEAPKASFGLFSRAILRLHEAVENMAAPGGAASAAAKAAEPGPAGGEPPARDAAPPARGRPITRPA